MDLLLVLALASVILSHIHSYSQLHLFIFYRFLFTPIVYVPAVASVTISWRSSVAVRSSPVLWIRNQRRRFSDIGVHNLIPPHIPISRYEHAQVKHANRITSATHSPTGPTPYGPVSRVKVQHAKIEYSKTEPSNKSPGNLDGLKESPR
jgi:hypothetical protein